MKKSFYSIIISSLIFNSCGDFEHKNMTEGPSQNVQGDIGLSAPGDLGSINQGSFALNKMISNIGINIITPAVADFKNNAEKLNDKTQVYCQIAETLTTDETVMTVLRTELQQTWSQAMKSYHYLEAAKFGPVAYNEEELGLKLYSWPLTNACRVDLEVVKASSRATYKLRDNLNTRGLDALEGLFFVNEDSHSCPRANSRLTAWLAKPLSQKRVDRCKIMKVVAKDLLENAKTLNKSWDLRQDHFTIQLVKDKSQQELLDASRSVSQSLFYVEEVVKDTKIGKDAQSCTKLTEHVTNPTMAASSILENLKGFKDVFNGVNRTTAYNGFGYDDYLRSLGFEGVSSQINTATDTAIQNFSDLINAQTEISKQDICARFDDVREITNVLKGEFLLALGKDSAPGQSQGDMD